ncbi:MAG: YceI-like domain, partial [Pseudonocardia sp.]|nr:YceI-like domain [Pseudonocardia sp.]
LDARRYPSVRADIDELAKLDSGRYSVRGKLSLHGITQEVSGEAAIAVGPDGVMKVDGELTLDIREYGLEPPKVLGLRVYPEVDVRLTVIATPD